VGLHTVEAWCTGHGLLINPDKTGLLAFTRKRKFPGFFEPQLFGRTLQHSTSVKYLGVILDSRLTWSQHVDAKVRKAQILLRACGRACGGAWGLGPRVAHWLYVSVIRPTVVFALLVGWPSCQAAKKNKKLSSIQRLACLGIRGAMSTTTTGAMAVLLCLPPLELVVLGEAMSAAHRLWSLGCWSYLHPNRGHSSVLTRLQQSDPIFSMGVDATRLTFNFEPRYRVTILHREDWTKDQGAPPGVKGLIWFTDGSKMRMGTGAICKKKAQLLPGQICNSLPGRDVCYLGLCL
jgi:hypothetical protein